MKRIIRLGVFVVLLMGCAMQQEEKEGYWGQDAYSITKIQDGVYKVTIRETPGQASPENPDIVRCADVAVAHGYSYFEFLDRRYLVIQCYKERPADAPGTIYDAKKLCSPVEEERE
jgi:hypothetical protein